jgi:pimeloyl-ACP methyl ester carboxylesterase
MGQGKPIILIHGLSGSSRWWGRNLCALGEHYRLYSIDLPGFGTMRRFRLCFALDEIASGIVLWMKAVGIKQAHLVGHSMGGYKRGRTDAENDADLLLIYLDAVQATRDIHSHKRRLKSVGVVVKQAL